MGNEKEPFEAVYEKQFSNIYNFIYGQLLHKERAEDLVSDIFIKAMTKVGKLDIHLTQEEAEYINDELGYGKLKGGMNSMDAKQVLMYARTRYVGDGDYERTERQRKVLTTAFDKLRKSSLPKIVRVAKGVIPYFTTDLTNRELLGYVYTVLQDDIKINRTTYRLPVDGAFSSQNINGMAVLVPDMEQNKEYLIEYLYGPEATEESAEEQTVTP